MAEFLANLNDEICVDYFEERGLGREPPPISIEIPEGVFPYSCDCAMLWFILTIRCDIIL